MTMMLDWTRRAACLEQDPELFFPISMQGPSQSQAEQAKQVCRHCPVREPCLEYALSTSQEYGVWGGTDPGQRRAMSPRALARRAERQPGPRAPGHENGSQVTGGREPRAARRGGHEAGPRTAAGRGDRSAVRGERQGGSRVASGRGR